MRVKQGPEARLEAVLWATVAVFYVRVTLHPIWKFVEVSNSDHRYLAAMSNCLELRWRLCAGNCRLRCFGPKHHSGFHVFVRVGRVPLQFRRRALFFRRKLREDIAHATPWRQGVKTQPGHILRRLLTR